MRDNSDSADAASIDSYVIKMSEGVACGTGNAIRNVLSAGMGIVQLPALLFRKHPQYHSASTAGDSLVVCVVLRIGRISVATRRCLLGPTDACLESQ